MTRQWYPREYKEGDEKDILDLYQLVFGTQMSTEHWVWEYKRSTAGEAVIIVAESDDGIVGQYALSPRLMKIGDSVAKGSLSFDTMVHPNYRGQGMFITLAEEAYELATRRGIHFIYGFPNANSHHGFVKKLGWADFDNKGIPLWIKPLNLENILKKRFVNNKLLAGLGGKAGNIVVRVLYRSTGNTPAGSITEISSFDRRFDSFWSEVSRDLGIMVVRDKGYLAWRYMEKPGSDYSVLIAEDGKDLLGYVVLKCMEDFGLQIGFIVDILTIPQEAKVPLSLISAAVSYFESRKMDIVSCLSLPNARYSRSLKRAGFIRAPSRLLPQDMYLGVRRFSSRYPVTFLTDPKNWFISWGDHDVV